MLTTPRLVLTTWLPTDVDALLEVHSDPETMLHVRHGRPETRAEVVDLIAHYLAEQANQGWTKWRLADLDGDLIGRAGFGSHAGSRQLAYVIRRSHEGRGLATEISTALVEWHLTHAPDVPLGGIVAEGNDASVRVLQKVGFDEVGTEVLGGVACRSFLYPA